MTITTTTKRDEHAVTVRGLTTRIANLKRENADLREDNERKQRQIEQLQSLVADMHDLRKRRGK